MRCTYCMPREIFGRDYQFLSRQQMLSYEEITRVVKAFVQLGTRKVRITGGEPLLRRQLPQLVKMLSVIPGLEDLTLTTNGALLQQYAQALADAGLQRLTVSLDAVDTEVFAAMTDSDIAVSQVMEGIQAAEAVGLGPIKINVVVKKNVNDHLVVDLARQFHGTGHIIRFIEYMDVGATNGWQLVDVVPVAILVDRINAVMPLEPLEPNYQGEVARRWRYVDGGGEVGFIASVSQPFCTDCTRARVSADGKVYTCLFSSQGHDLRHLLRSGSSPHDLTQVIDSIWHSRKDRYSELRAAQAPSFSKVEMSYIGG